MYAEGGPALREAAIPDYSGENYWRVAEGVTWAKILLLVLQVSFRRQNQSIRTSKSSVSVDVQNPDGSVEQINR